MTQKPQSARLLKRLVAILGVLLIPFSCRLSQSALDRQLAEARIEGEAIIYAIDAYRRRTGMYPEALSHLRDLDPKIRVDEWFYHYGSTQYMIRKRASVGLASSELAYYSDGRTWTSGSF